MKPRWGPYHRGALELAGLYSRGKRTQEIVCVCMCITLMVVNLYFMAVHFRVEKVGSICLVALAGIFTADFASGLVHWAADTWGSVELPVLGKKLKDLTCAHEYAVAVSNRFDVLGALGDPVELWIPSNVKLYRLPRSVLGSAPGQGVVLSPTEMLEKIEESRAARLAGNRDQHRGSVTPD
ncbi:Transmembrane protein 189 [Chionoecetes opilio]|uniref:Transmembrane protein 189 n=1 Tax=Chionoecetes opilio TaxID=41210 RepID=A0A8J5CR89_CHIOP|nr:Transmembrane protein 189 [Chionoecetes opilio]